MFDYCLITITKIEAISDTKRKSFRKSEGLVIMNLFKLLIKNYNDKV